MRILLAAIVVSTGVTAACAADLPVDASPDYATYGSVSGQRSGTLVVYDYQPGVVVRAYWQTPWRHRHYYPHAGEQPELGRDEDLSAPRHLSAPPQSFNRTWSTVLDLPAPPPRVGAPRASQNSGPSK